VTGPLMDEQRRRQYLEAMGIPLWESRHLAESEPVATPAVAEQPAQPVPSKPVMVESPGEEPPPWLSEAPPILEETLAPVESEEPALFDAPRNDLSALGWDELQQRVRGCKACDLHRTRTQTVFGVGNRQADLLIIGEAPGADEDKQGEPFVGRAGQLLNAMLQAIGFKREEVFIANILKCRPPDNRDPQSEEALCCEPFLMRQVDLVAPKVILAVGRVAAHNLLKTDEAVGRLRGRVHRFGNNAVPLIVSYHPAYLLRSPDQKGKAWQDLQQVMSLLRQG